MLIPQKKIDIIVPIYNQELVIDNFLESAYKINSDYSNIILINDGSTDNTLEKISCFISKTNATNFHLVSKKNTGVSSTRNFGLSLSKSEYIWFCDPDDLIISNLDFFFKDILDNPADLYLFNFEHYFESKKNLTIRTTNKYGVFSKSEITLELMWKRLNSQSGNNFLIYPWDKIIKRKIIEHNFNENLSVYEDQLFNFNLINSKKLNSIKVIDIAIYRYHTYSNKNTLSSSWSEKKTEDFCYFVNQLKESLDIETSNFIFSERNLILKRSLRVSKIQTFIFIKKTTKVKIKNKYQLIELLKSVLIIAGIEKFTKRAYYTLFPKIK